MSSKIVFNSKKYTTVSVRLKSNIAADIDLVTKNIGIILGDEISRNLVLEKLVGDAINNSVFLINGEEMTYREILNYTTDPSEDISPEDNKELENKNASL